jgi:rhodanese-related sulfurtransferase
MKPHESILWGAWCRGPTTGATTLEHRALLCQTSFEGEIAMPQNITTGYKALVEAAEKEIETVPTAEAIKLAGRDDTVLVDIRDIRELERDGRVPGAFHCPRGMLEFWIDPNGSYFKPVFGEDKKFVFFCAGGLRSALAAQTAQRMGLKPVAHIQGGFGAWKKTGGPVEPGTK